MYIRSIRLCNIRDFSDFTLNLDADGKARLWTVVVGSNGVGKTTLLRAIALALASETDANAMIAASPIARMLRHGEQQGIIEVRVSEHIESGDVASFKTTIQWDINHETARREIVHSPGSAWATRPPFLAGYGVARIRTGNETQRIGRLFDTTQSLFNYDATLTPLELILRRLQDHLGQPAYAAALAGVKRALKLSPETEISLPSGGGVDIRTGPMIEPIRLEGWADGYRLNFSWIVDFFGVAMASEALNREGEIRGILLLDEIEQHTHPSIQDTLVAELKALWPQLQVITTTHSPLVVLGAKPEEIVVLRRTGDGHVEQEAQPTTFEGYSAQDILTDERIFATGAKSVETLELEEKYKALISQPPENQTIEDQNNLKALAKRLQQKVYSEETRDLPSGSAARDDSMLLKDLKDLRKKYNL